MNPLFFTFPVSGRPSSLSIFSALISLLLLIGLTSVSAQAGCAPNPGTCPGTVFCQGETFCTGDYLCLCGDGQDDGNETLLGSAPTEKGCETFEGQCSKPGFSVRAMAANVHAAKMAANESFNQAANSQLNCPAPCTGGTGSVNTTEETDGCFKTSSSIICISHTQ